ncbi:MAG: NAD-dependent epimerase/dehydratase family protein [Chloroflexi bacterium]|nr:NAD-dependent epimerase/dehydratase family protein [Chloroflexota bacterium]
MQFLITGGTGFLGTALANFLVAQGHLVRALDDMSAGESNALDPRVLFTRGDVRDIPKLWSLLKGVDGVYHLAARVSVPESVLYPVEYNAVNVGGTVSLMTAVRDAGVKRVVFASSGAVYGKQDSQPVAENFSPHPDSPYAVSKLAAEYYLHSIGALWKIETVVLRIFNAYGPRQPMPPSHAPVIPRVLKQVIGGGSVVVFGDGKQSRDFVYVADVVQALAATATVARVNRAMINIGSGQEVSIAALVDRAERVTKREAHRLYNAEETSGVPRLVANINLAKELLDWQPQVALDEGLQRMLREDARFKK